MRNERTRCILFRGEELIPKEWRYVPGDPLRTFNPSILPCGEASSEEWLFAYRVVLPDEVRRIALCRLDRSFRVIPESHIPLSDELSNESSSGESVRSWFADPRLYRLSGRLFLYWNSGWHEPENQQFLQELDPQSFRPIGKPRTMRLEGQRQKLEKNWMLFSTQDTHAVYSPSPQRILRFSLEGDGDIVFHECESTEWDLSVFTETFGALRGGAPPLRIGERFVSVCHALRADSQGVNYVAAAYTFDARPPFRPRERPSGVLLLGNPYGAKTNFPRLNGAVHQVIYPGGLAANGEQLIISYGINDEHCAISLVAIDALPLAPLQLPLQPQTREVRL